MSDRELTQLYLSGLEGFDEQSFTLFVRRNLSSRSVADITFVKMPPARHGSKPFAFINFGSAAIADAAFEELKQSREIADMKGLRVQLQLSEAARRGHGGGGGGGASTEMGAAMMHASSGGGSYSDRFDDDDDDGQRQQQQQRNRSDEYNSSNGNNNNMNAPPRPSGSLVDLFVPGLHLSSERPLLEELGRIFERAPQCAPRSVRTPMKGGIATFGFLTFDSAEDAMRGRAIIQDVLLRIPASVRSGTQMGLLQGRLNRRDTPAGSPQSTGSGRGGGGRGFEDEVAAHDRQEEHREVGRDEHRRGDDRRDDHARMQTDDRRDSGRYDDRRDEHRRDDDRRDPARYDDRRDDDRREPARYDDRRDDRRDEHRAPQQEARRDSAGSRRFRCSRCEHELDAREFSVSEIEKYSASNKQRCLRCVDRLEVLERELGAGPRLPERRDDRDVGYRGASGGGGPAGYRREDRDSRGGGGRGDDRGDGGDRPYSNRGGPDFHPRAAAVPVAYANPTRGPPPPLQQQQPQHHQAPAAGGGAATTRPNTIECKACNRTLPRKAFDGYEQSRFDMRKNDQRCTSCALRHEEEKRRRDAGGRTAPTMAGQHGGRDDGGGGAGRRRQREDDEFNHNGGGGGRGVVDDMDDEFCSRRRRGGSLGGDE